MSRNRDRSARRLRRNDPRNVWMRLVWGVLLLTAGVIFWLDRMGRVDAREYLHWWPLATIAVGLAHVPQRRWAGAAIWLTVGTFFLLPRLGYSTIPLVHLFGLWPLLFTAGGLTLVHQALRPRPAGLRFSTAAVMSGNVLRVGSQPFASADVVAVMGGCAVDLANVQPVSGEVEIHVLAFWGGIEIRVPRGWGVDNRVLEILGGVEDKTIERGDNAPRVVIRGSAIMGGVEVKNSAEAAA